MQIEASLRYHFSGKNPKFDNTFCCQGCGNRHCRTLPVGEYICTAQMEDNWSTALKIPTECALRPSNSTLGNWPYSYICVSTKWHAESRCIAACRQQWKTGENLSAQQWGHWLSRLNEVSVNCKNKYKSSCVLIWKTL